LVEWSIKELAALYFSYFSERFTPELAKTFKAPRDLVFPQGCAREIGSWTGQAYEKSRKDCGRRLV
jgi:hypothetical protein